MIKGKFMQISLADLVNKLQELGETVINSEQILANTDNHFTKITTIAPIDTANPQNLTFLANPHYQKLLATTQATAILIQENLADKCPSTCQPIIVKSPYLAYAKLSQIFVENVKNSGIHPTTIIDPTAIIGDNVSIGAFCQIGKNTTIGNNCQIESHCTIGDNVILGNDCLLKSHVFINHRCQLGNDVMLHSHASIGNEGFGFAPKGDPATHGWQKIHQLGRVIIGNQVRIGSQTCVDCGALGDTVIEDNVIIDNLVQIAHNVHIGAGTAIAGCVGIAGSSKVGKRCVLAGGVGLVGHIEICDDVTITGMTMVTKSITKSGSYSSGTPMLPTNIWKKTAIKFKQLLKDDK